MNHQPQSPTGRRAFVTRSVAALAATSAAGLPLIGRSQTTTAPLKLALISAATYGLPGQVRTPGSHHGTAFATTFNGWDAEKAKLLKGTFVKSGRRLEGARVVKI